MKKVLFPILALVLAVGLALPMAAPVRADPGSIVGLWHLDEGIESTASDSSGAGNDGTLSGGKFGNALSFDGAGDYVEVGDDSTLDITDGITLEAWIYPDAVNGYRTVVAKREGNLANYALRLQNGKLDFYYSGPAADGGTDWHAWQTSSAVISTGSWYHVAVAFTFDSGGSITAYVNGAAVSGSWYADDGTDPATPNSYALTIGMGPPGSQYFDGLIDEVRISNVARTITPSNLTSAPSVDGSTVALWHLDESVGSTAYDATANGNDGTITGASWAGPTWTTSGMFDDALSFDGSDDYVDCGDISTANWADLTTEAWVYWDGGTVSGYAGVYHKAYHNDIGRLLINSAGKVLVQNGNGNFFSGNDGDVPTNQWCHIVYTYDQSAGKEYIYVDGVKVGEQARTGVIAQNSADFWIGYGWHGSTYYVFSGLIDEVRVWDTAYPGLEVSADPTSDYNPVTFQHEITATVDPVLPDGATVGLEVTAGPNTGATDIGDTDANGEVTLSYTDTGSIWTGGTETDTIRIWVDRNWDDSYDSSVDFATTVTKDWVKLASLIPLEAYNPVGTNHEVEATISSAVDGITIRFEVSGANSASGSAVTDDGEATFSYNGANPGTDTIRAYFDTDGSGTWDDNPEEPSLTVTKYWLEHYVTGGGNITEGRGKDAAKITFGGNVGFDLLGDEVGQWQVNFHNVNNNALDKGHFHSTVITHLSFVDFSDSPENLPDPSPPEADYNYVMFKATGRFNGEDGWKIQINATDFGEGNKTEPDEIRIRLWSPSESTPVYDSCKTHGGDFPDESFHVRTNLDGGNLQIHPPEIPE